MLDLDFSECRPVKVVRNPTPLREPAVPWVRRGQSKLIRTPLLRACVVACVVADEKSGEDCAILWRRVWFASACVLFSLWWGRLCGVLC